MQSNIRDVVGELNDTQYQALIHGAIWFFLILFSYYILRPIREQISTSYGIENLTWLFWAVFLTMLLAIPFYSYLVGKFDRRHLVPSVYALFFLSLVAFWAAMSFAHEGTQIWISRCLFVWISFYGLFIVSFFWSVLGDLLTTSEGQKLFGYIFGSGTIGGMAGSQAAIYLVKPLGIANLLLLPAALLFLAYVVYWHLERKLQQISFSAIAKNGKATGGNPFAGFTAVFKSRYLFAICMFGLLLAICGTTVYYQQSEIVAQAIETKEERTAYFASINFYVSLVTLVFQFFVAGFLMRKIGLGWTLACLPLAYILGISSLALSPSITVLAIVSVFGRAAEYGISNPAREVLYTSVIREDRYKAKSFIDTVVRRGGDSVVGNLYQTAREGLGLSLVSMSLVALPVAAVWDGCSIVYRIRKQEIDCRTEVLKPFFSQYQPEEIIYAVGSEFLAGASGWCSAGLSGPNCLSINMNKINMNKINTNKINMNKTNMKKINMNYFKNQTQASSHCTRSKY